MAFITDTGSAAAKPSFFATVKDIIANSFDVVMMAHGRSEDIARFQNMSDRQLADIGIARDDIVAHVFRDKFSI